MKQTRRDFIKTNAVAATAAAAGITIPGVQAIAAEKDLLIGIVKKPEEGETDVWKMRQDFGCVPSHQSTTQTLNHSAACPNTQRPQTPWPETPKP